MKRSLVTLLIIFILSIFLGAERDRGVVRSDYELSQSSFDNHEDYTISQGVNYTDLQGQRGVSSSSSISKLVNRNSASRRNLSNNLSGIRIAIANLYSECSYSYSCDFPFEHQPQRKLFYILRNIRI